LTAVCLFVLKGATASAITLVTTSFGTDLAIDGDGYFVIRDPETGDLRLTRYGEFHEGPANHLETLRGERVQGLLPDGTTIGDVLLGANLPPDLLTWPTEIGANGRIRVALSNGAVLEGGTIRLWKPADPGRLITVDESSLLDPSLQDSWPNNFLDPGSTGMGTIVRAQLEQPGPRIRVSVFDRSATAFTAGPIIRTSIQTHLALTGPGFFPVRDPATGQKYLTRCGAFKLDRDGWMVTVLDEFRLQMETTGGLDDLRVVIGERPADPNAYVGGFDISSDGTVQLGLNDGTVLTVGRVVLSQVEHPEQLVPVNDHLFLQPTAPLPESVGTEIRMWALDFNQITPAVLESWRMQTREIQGGIMPMDSPAFLAISGDGWFVIRDPLTDRRLYTRVGMFGWTADGYLETLQGWRVQARGKIYSLITLLPTLNSYRLSEPKDLRLPVDESGKFSSQWNIDGVGQVLVPNPYGYWVARFEICLARVRDVTDLEEFSPDHFTLDGNVTLQSPGAAGLGRLATGALENIWAIDSHVPDSAPPKGILVSAWGLVGRTADILSVKDLSTWGAPPANNPLPWIFLNRQTTVGTLESRQSVVIGTDETNPMGFYKLRIQ